MTTRQIFIPQYLEDLTLAEDWSVELAWVSRNLVLLRKFNLTGMKTFSYGSSIKYDEETKEPMRNDDGSFMRVEHTYNKTIPNPLFKDYEGNYAPAQVTIVAGTVLHLSKLYFGFVDLKITSSPDKRLNGRVLQVTVETFNTAVMKR